MNHTKQRYTALRAVKQELDIDKDYELAVKEWKEQWDALEGNCAPAPADVISFLTVKVVV